MAERELEGESPGREGNTHWKEERLEGRWPVSWGYGERVSKGPAGGSLLTKHIAKPFTL